MVTHFFFRNLKTKICLSIHVKSRISEKNYHEKRKFDYDKRIFVLGLMDNDT